MENRGYRKLMKLYINYKYLWLTMNIYSSMKWFPMEETVEYLWDMEWLWNIIVNVWGKNNGISIDIEWIYLLYSIVYMGYFVINPCSYGFCLDSCLNSQPTYIGGG